MKEVKLTISNIENSDSECNIPFIESKIAAGFPSPCQDYMEGSIDFNKELVKHPSATFCARVSGNSMLDAGEMFVLSAVLL